MLFFDSKTCQTCSFETKQDIFSPFFGSFPKEDCSIKVKVNKMWETLNGEDKSLTLRSNHASKDFLSKLQDCRVNKHFTDVTLITEDGQQITAHKIGNVQF